MTDTELKTTIIGSEFLKHARHPSVDTFLDHRSKMVEYIGLSKEYDDFIEREIKATDEILKRLTDE